MNQSHSIFHLTTDLSGGAGVAAKRLHSALLDRGLESYLIFRNGSTPVENSKADRRYSSVLWRNLNSFTVTRQWQQSSNQHGMFTSPEWIYKTRLSDLSPIPQIVNLHWISRWIDQPHFFSSLPPGLPIVWSLHDMNPLTGGCHHALTCDRFTSHCQFCPNLKKPGSRDAAWKNFQTKAQLYQRLNLHIVGNSTWTTAQAQKSALMKSAKSFQTIPLGINTSEYAPVVQSSARDSLRIQPSEFAIAFACADLSDQNKNLAMLLEAIHSLSSHVSITLIVFGAGDLPAIAPHIRVIHLGAISSSALQCIAYSAADVFVMPSRIESFGLTALEAMACGTPVVAFRTGGLPDIVIQGETGLLEETIDTISLYRALEWMHEHPAERAQMGFASRQRVEQHFTDKKMAECYAQIYSQLLKV